MKLLRSTVKILAALLVSAAIWEVLLRLFIIGPIPEHYNPELGWISKPFSRGLQTDEGRGVLRYNELGFRDAPVSKKAPGEFRILALGDSYTEGRQMSLSLTYPARLQQLLRAKNATAITGRRARVLNGGRIGTSPAWAVYFADRYQKVFEPDWVVLLVRDGGWPLTLNRTKEIFYRPLDDGFEIKRQGQWARMSRHRRFLLQLGARNLAVFQYGVRSWHFMTATDDEENGGIARKKHTRSTRAALSVRAIDWTAQQLRQKYPRLVIVHMPSSQPARNGLLPPQPEEKALIAACRRYGIPLITMREKIVGDYQQTGQPAYGFSNTLPWAGHPNAHGHELVAHALYEFFVGKLRSGAQPSTPAVSTAHRLGRER